MALTDQPGKKQPGGKWVKGEGSPNPGGKRRQAVAIPEPVQPENAGRNPDGTFAKGSSANPAGKPKGARHRATMLAEALLDGQVEELMQKAVAMALAGDASVMRALLDRLVPPRKERPIRVDLPRLEKTGDLVAAVSAIAQAVGDGELTAGEGVDLSRLFANVAQTIEVAELEQRLQKVEDAIASKGDPS